MHNELQEKVLQEALTLFFEKGYEKTTTREIAERAGIERGHLYYYYKKKEDLLFGWYNQFLSIIQEAVEEKYRDEKNGYVLILLSDWLYYQAIKYEKRFLKLLSTILENRNLTKVKIDNTFKEYKKILDERHMEYDVREMHIGTCILIGAEVELFLRMMEEDSDMSYDEFVERVLKIHLHTFGLPKEEENTVMQQLDEKISECNEDMIMKITKDAYIV